MQVGALLPEATVEAGANVSQSRDPVLGWQPPRISRKGRDQVDRFVTVDMLSNIETICISSLTA